jgi:DNA repair protein RadD
VLRGYQVDAKRESYAALRKDERAMLMMPTGSGKTHVAMAMIKDGLRNDRKITFICDRISLIDQTFRKFHEEGLPTGVIQGGHPMFRPNLPVQVASIQTLNRRRDWNPTDFLIVDEAHTQYNAINKQMDRWNALKWLGLSATPFTRGLGLTWKNLVCTVTTGELIRDGFLCPYQAYGYTQPDLTKVRTRMGDFAVNDMEAPCNEIVGSVVEHYLTYGEGRKALGFSVNVAHALELTAEFTRKGLRADYVCGKDTPERRYEVLENYRNGGLDALFNCEVMTKGMDIPDIGALLLCRPTKSLSLHIQMMGRGLRVAEGKTDLLMLDHAGNIERLGFPDDDLPTEMCMQEKGTSEVDKKDKDEPQPWNCPECHHLVPVKTRACPCCGFIPVPQAEVVVKKGFLKKLESSGRANKQEVYSQLNCIAQDRGYEKGWTAHKFKAIFGVFPRGMQPFIAVPTPEIRSWVKSQQIRYAKAKGKN